ncbi:MAG: glycoside hydrolase, partial [Candidatus Deferrimicrobiaceae bacterium]
MFRINPPIPRQALRESVLLLKRNLTPRGIVAASATPESAARNYTRVFCRDASISAMGMAVSGDPLLREGAMAGLEFLASHQAENGQIPNFVAPETGETDFWYLGCIDATLWWLTAVGFWSRHFPQDCVEDRFRGRIDAALRWLLCQEHQKIRLLQQNEASDWADIMPRSGFVLYTNALWYHVKRVYSIAGAEETRG